MKEQILTKLYEVSKLLELVDCDGEPIVGSDVHSELAGKLNALTDAVEYYVD